MKKQKALFQEAAWLINYKNPAPDLYKGQEAKLGADELKSNLDSAFNQLTETITRVMADQSEFIAPGLFDAFMNELKLRSKSLEQHISKEYRKLKSATSK